MSDEKKSISDDRKALTRRALIATRETLATSTRAQAERSIAMHVQEWLRQNTVQVVGAYLPMRHEVDLREILLWLHQQGLKIALPVVEQFAAPLVFRTWRGEALSERDLAGVRAPMDAPRLEPEALLVPCVGFNEHGYRLGYGGGYYDRTLSAHPHWLAAGVAFSLQRAHFTPDEHDVRLHAIITEQGIQTF